MGSMKNKVAIVTGSTQGLGAAIARLFAERGAVGLVTCGRNHENGEQVAEEIRKTYCCDVRYVAADLASLDDCRKIVQTAEQAFGRVDTLVNAAAISDRGTLMDTSPDLFDRIMAVNLRAPFYLMQGAVALMRKAGVQGTMVNIVSMSSLAGQPYVSAYCASKGGLATLTRNTGFALLPDRIRVNGINIGWMASEGEHRIQQAYHDAEDNWLEWAAKAQPFGRLIDPAEVARVAAFLASDESGLMTGEVVNFDQSVWGGYEAPPVPAVPI
ncbi:SDR family oxidoreductase [Halovulum sp. GXIMD14794]